MFSLEVAVSKKVNGLANCRVVSHDERMCRRDGHSVSHVINHCTGYGDTTVIWAWDDQPTERVQCTGSCDDAQRVIDGAQQLT